LAFQTVRPGIAAVPPAATVVAVHPAPGSEEGCELRRPSEFAKPERSVDEDHGGTVAHHVVGDRGAVAARRCRHGGLLASSQLDQRLRDAFAPPCAVAVVTRCSMSRLMADVGSGSSKGKCSVDFAPMWRS